MQEHRTFLRRDVDQIPERAFPKGRRRRMPGDDGGLQRPLHADLHLPPKQNQVSAFKFWFLVLIVFLLF